MYDVHLGLIEKRVVDFLLELIKLFSLGVSADVLRVGIDRKSAISLCDRQWPSALEIAQKLIHRRTPRGRPYYITQKC